MPRRVQQSIAQMAEHARVAPGDRAADHCDLQIDLVDERSGKLLCRAGGVWDLVERRYVADSRRSRVIRLHPGQLAAARWFDEWLEQYLGPPRRQWRDPIHHLLVAGGRRGGKSAFAFTSAVTYGLAVPGSTIWIVVPSDAFFHEPIKYLEAIMPVAWYESLGAPSWTYFLKNGSTITLRSGFTPQKLKQGEADYIVINEGQQLPPRSLTTMSGGIIDEGGLVTVAANPPDVGDKGTWVADMALECNAKMRKHARYFPFDPERNPHINQRTLRAMREIMGQHEYDVQIRGLFLNPPDSVLYAWNQMGNESPTPDFGDCTEEFTTHYEGRAYKQIVGVDVQNYPWIAAVICRVFRNPAAPTDMSQALLWVVAEAFVEKGDEVVCAQELKLLGCKPDETLVITDASADWQQQERATLEQRVKYVGMGSMDIFRGEGFLFVVPPDTDMNANPKVVDRCRAANARIGNAAGRRFVFADPVKAKKTIASVRQWKISKTTGLPSRRSNAAHGGDALTYIIWHYWPRRRSGTVEIETFKANSSSARPRPSRRGGGF